MKVLVACEFSGIVRDEFIKRGHEAWSCDLLPCERDNTYHLQRDVLEVLKETDGWDLMIAHPTCTYLTNAGVRHLYSHVTSVNGKRAKIHGEERWRLMEESAHFFKALLDADIPRVCVENPIPHKYAREITGKYTQIIQPWQFGHGEVKATCLWLRGLPPLKPTKIVEGRHARCHLEPPGPNRWKNRSRTYSGIAEAMADQFTK